MPRGILAIPDIPPDDVRYPFITFNNYIGAALRIAKRRYGKDLDELYNGVAAHAAFSQLKRPSVDTREVCRHLRSVVY